MGYNVFYREERERRCKEIEKKANETTFAHDKLNSQVDDLKKQEEELGFTERPDGMKTFFAKGQAGVWRDELTAEQVARIREAFLPTLEKWYPELLEETKDFAKAG